MRFTSNILGELSSVIKRSIVGSFETDISIPPVIQPVVTLRNACRVLNPAVTDVTETSNIAEFNFGVANAGTQTNTLLQLAPGTWELDVQVTYSANYVSGVAGFFLQLIFVGEGTANILKMFSEVTAGGMMVSTRKLQWEADATVQLIGVLGANGVGNSHRAHVGVLANRLL